jgi:transcriptional regulator with XRE-family HTH domain
MPRPKVAEAPQHQTTTSVDRYVGARMRERRIMLGLSQVELAKLAGVTYQQMHKYEAGINRVSAGRLYRIAQALGAEAGYFFEGLAQQPLARKAPQQRLILELTRHFTRMSNSRHKEALCTLARVLASEQGPDLRGLDDQEGR